VHSPGSASWPNVTFDYSGADVLVTGGTSGIGAGIAAAYREAGARVTITGTRATASDYDVDLSGYQYLQLDVENDTDIERVASGLTGLDVLVNNAGIALPAHGFDEYDPVVFERAVRMHLTSAYRISRACRVAPPSSASPPWRPISLLSSYRATERRKPV
jgi:3-oxoacyl-[acyl-carrier protein] reductase